MSDLGLNANSMSLVLAFACEGTLRAEHVRERNLCATTWSDPAAERNDSLLSLLPLGKAVSQLSPP